MTVVVDASVAVHWLLKTSGSGRAYKVLREEPRIIAPDLVLADIANAVFKAATVEGLPKDVALEAAREAHKAFDELIPAARLAERALSIALELKRPAHDCFCLALAEARDTTLVTADDRLLRQCAPTRFASLLKAM